MSRSNAEAYEIHELGVSCREETWAINFAYAHLMRAFCEQHNFKPEYYPHASSADPYKACSYKRSANLCYNYLVARSLYDRDSGTPVHENLVAVAVQYAKPPLFSLECQKSEYPHGPIVTPSEGYTSITSLKIREFFHVYLNPDVYHILSYTKTVTHGGTNYYRRGRYSSVPETTKEVSQLKVFLKDMVPLLHTNLCHVKMELFLKQRLQLSSKIFFDLDIKNLDNERENFNEITCFSYSTPLTIGDLDKRIARAAEAASFFVKACEDLKNLRAKIETYPAIDFKEESYQKALAYFTENAPLHINDEDAETRQLCALIMENADTKRIAVEWQNHKYLKQFQDRKV